MEQPSPRRGTFVGREAEMGLLRASVDEALGGRARFVLLSGDPGIGKSRTAEEVAAYARERGAQVFWGRCYESEGAPPFWPWVQVLRAALGKVDEASLHTLLGDDGSAVAQLLPELRTRLPDLPRPPATESDAARQRLFESVGAVLRNLARTQPVTIIVDDLQGADQPSALLLRFIVETLTAEAALPVLLLGSCRTAALDRGAFLGDLLAALADADTRSRVPLRGLLPAEVARFIEAYSGTAAPAELLPRLCEVTEGNPLFLKECAALLAAADAAPALTIPSTVTLIIQQRLAALTPACREVLAIASAIGREVPAAVLGEVAALDAPAVSIADVVRDAVQHALFVASEHEETYRFSHALVRDALYAHLPAAKRPQVHRRIGAALSHGPDVEERLGELAHHFFQAGAPDDVVTGAGYAQRAAERALRVLAYEEALRLCELGLAALDSLGDGHDLSRCELLLTLAHAQKSVVDTQTARATYQRAAELARHLSAPELLAKAVLGTFWRNDRTATQPEEVRLLEDTLVVLGDDDSVLRVKLLGQLANQLHFNVESHERAKDLGEAAVAMARRLGDGEALSDILATWYQNSWRAANLDERLSVANELVGLGETLANRGIAAQGSLLRAYCLFELGEFSGMEQEIQRYQRYAEAIRVPSRLYWAPFVRATLATASGRFAEAERWAGEALEIGQRAQEVDALPLYMIQTARILHAQGRLAVDGFLGGAALTGNYAWHWAPLSAYVVFAIDLGLEADARERYERLAARDFEDVPLDVGWLSTVSNLAYGCSYFEDTRRAHVLYPLLLPFGSRNMAHGWGYGCNGSGARYLGLLAATLSRWDEAVQHFEDAIAHNTRMGARPFCARTQFEYARLLVTRNASGDQASAATLLQAALATASELGMAPLVAKAEALLNAR